MCYRVVYLTVNGHFQDAILGLQGYEQFLCVPPSVSFVFLNVINLLCNAKQSLEFVMGEDK